MGAGRLGGLQQGGVVHLGVEQGDEVGMKSAAPELQPAAGLSHLQGCVGNCAEVQLHWSHQTQSKLDYLRGRQLRLGWPLLDQSAFLNFYIVCT